jgi:hypothetical protein
LHSSTLEQGHAAVLEKSFLPEVFENRFSGFSIEK